MWPPLTVTALGPDRGMAMHERRALHALAQRRVAEDHVRAAGVIGFE